ncbi:MAG: sulfatase-like hydrolase/transferase [Candidatus Omnitrophica bacterium]|nr:sulfatase-like hydrolase/transferase [Candidatus Omnitrophota bacterium]
MNTRLSQFWFTIQLALFAGLLFSFYEIPRVINEQNYLYFHLWHISLGVVSKLALEILLVFSAAGIILGLAGFAYPASGKTTYLVILQGFLIVLFLGSAVLIKRYFADALPGHLVYWAFDGNRWIKEHITFLGFFLPALFIFSPVIAKKPPVFSIILKISLFFFIAATLILKITTTVWGLDAQNHLKSENAPNVILLTVDTLRADHLGLYGYSRNTSPALDQFGKENIVFKSAVCQWPKTSQSFAALLTGTYFYQTGCSINVATQFPRRNLSMPEIFLNAGYKTAGFVSNANLAKYFNFDQGFEEYEELWKKKSGPAREKQWDTADIVVDRAERWLQKNGSSRFFLWVHMIDPHAPYTPPAPFDTAFTQDGRNEYDPVTADKIKPHVFLDGKLDPDEYIAQYDGEILFTDSQIARFLNILKELHLENNTIIVFTADHGESFTEHHFYFDHGKFAFEDCVHVPFILKAPTHFTEPKSIDSPVSSIDIAPTLLGLANITLSRPPFQGKNLNVLIEGKAQPENFQYQFIEAGIRENYQRAVRDKEWKLLYAPDLEDQKDLGVGAFSLYRYTQDKKEVKNVIDAFPAEAGRLKGRLAEWLDQGLKKDRVGPSSAGQSNQQNIDKRTLEQLKSFGYL